MIAYKMGFAGEGWKPALAQAPLVLPKGPETQDLPGAANSTSNNTLMVLGLAALAVVLVGTIIISQTASRD
jgi:hypothetical protein